MAVAAQNNSAVQAILKAFGLDGQPVTKLDIRCRVDEMITARGAIIKEGVHCKFEHFVDQQTLDTVAKSIQLEMNNAFQIAADWLEEHNHAEAAKALRRHFDG